MFLFIQECKRYGYSNVYGSFCYRLLPDIVDTQLGEDSCVDMGGHLLSITSDDELDAVADYVTDLTNRRQVMMITHISIAHIERSYC